MTQREPIVFSGLCFGFFDSIPLRQRELVVRHSLDTTGIARAFRECGGTLADGSGQVDGHRFTLHAEGFLESTSVLATRRGVDFIRETGCEIAAPSFGGTISLESLVANYDHLSSIFAAPPADDGWAAGRSASR